MCVIVVTASEGTGKLNIGKPREDERFGNYTYRHEVVHGVTYPPGQTQDKIDLMRWRGRPTSIHTHTCLSMAAGSPRPCIGVLMARGVGA